MNFQPGTLQTVAHLSTTSAILQIADIVNFISSL
jgi:hypothetical protein